MNKYLKPMLLSFQSVFQYRANVVLYMFFGLIPLIAMILLWHSLYGEGEVIQGYTLEMIITYTIIAKMIELVLLPEMHWSINDEIRSGELSKYLTKPISYFGYWISRNMGNKLVQLMMAAVPLIPIIYMNRKHFLWPKPGMVLPFLISLIGAFVLYFMIYYLVSLLSFHFVEISAFFFTVDIFLELLAGSLIPLELLPKPIDSITQLLPFAYLIHFPANIYLGNVGMQEIVIGVIAQFVWSLLFFLLIKVFWKKGMNKYESVGA